MDHRTVRELNQARASDDLGRLPKDQESKRNWTYIIFLLSRLFLGGIFVYASYDKIIHPVPFAEIVYNYQILPDALVNLVSLFLPWLELLVGLSLILGVWLPGSVLMCNVLLLFFFGTLVFNLARGLDIDCGCFTVSVGSSSGGHMLWYLFRDGLFLFVGLFLFFYSFFMRIRARLAIRQTLEDPFWANTRSRTLGCSLRSPREPGPFRFHPSPRGLVSGSADHIEVRQEHPDPFRRSKR